jgi:co-chaperonin GroES (HSP10)
MDLQPHGTWILVQPYEEEHATESGIIFPDEARRNIWKRGKVLAKGNGTLITKGPRKGTLLPVDVEVGEVVWYLFALEKTHTGIQLKSTLGNAFLIQEKDVVGVEEDRSF